MQLLPPDWLAGCRTGDQECYRLVFERYQHEAYRLALLLTRSRQDAEDAVQEAFVRAFRHLGTYDPLRPFRPWFMRIVANSALNVVRRRSPIRLLQEWLGRNDQANTWRAWSELQPGGGPEGAWDLAAAVTRLPEAFRTVVVLHYYSQFSHEEIAGILGIPAGTVKSRLFRAVRRLRTDLGLAEELPAALSALREEVGR